MKEQEFLDAVNELAERWRGERAERQGRRALQRADFDALGKAGFRLTGVPSELGGLWRGASGSVRLVSTALRRLGGVDSSVALVSAMHPAVLSYWLTTDEAAVTTSAWREQRRTIFEDVLAGAWWGTVTSEPGSGGDVARTRAVARASGDSHALSGDKHFGSGTGMVDLMVTSAVPEGESDPDWFFVDLRDCPLDGTRGVEIIGEWDGSGMVATQSHSLRFDRFPVTRIAWPGNLQTVAARTGAFIGCLFTSVIVGVVDAAVGEARRRVRPGESRTFEAIEMARAETEHWLLGQALEGMIRAVEDASDENADPRHDVLRGKTAAAELAESILTRLCRALGGGTFSRRSPFAHWFEDVRALGFLRPPWGLAMETLIE